VVRPVTTSISGSMSCGRNRIRPCHALHRRPPLWRPVQRRDRGEPVRLDSQRAQRWLFRREFPVRRNWALSEAGQGLPHLDRLDNEAGIRPPPQSVASVKKEKSRVARLLVVHSERRRTQGRTPARRRERASRAPPRGRSANPAKAQAGAARHLRRESRRAPLEGGWSWSERGGGWSRASGPSRG
jgi:hypothetical protein